MSDAPYDAIGINHNIHVCDGRNRNIYIFYYCYLYNGYCI